MTDIVKTAPMGPRKRVDAATRRQLILDAAAGLFLHQPYQDVTTKALADAAGVSEALVFQHFGSKRDLYAAVVQLAVDDVTRHLTDTFTAIAELPEVTEERLEEIFAVSLAFWFAEPDVVRSFLTEQKAEDARHAFYRVVLEQEATLLPVLERARARGVLPDVDPRVLLRALVGQTLVFVVTEQWLGGEALEPIDRSTLPRDLARLWAGLLGGFDGRAHDADHREGIAHR